ncbi:MAG: apolipoprotein N-acyltransferase [Pseudomonadota bacterium]
MSQPLADLRLRERVAALGLWQRLLLAVLAGLGLTLAQPPVSFPFALFIVVPLLVWLVDATPSPRAAALTGWAVGFGMFVSGLHWMGHAFLVDAERFAWLLPFAVTLLPAGLAVFWAAAFWLAKKVWHDGWGRALLLAVMIGLAEFARSTVLTGFPWGLPGYAWVETPVMQAVRYVGPHGMTFLTLALCALPLIAGLQRPVAWVALAVLAGLWAEGATRAHPPAPIDPPVLRIVQPNAAQHLKWKPGHRERFAARLEALSSAPAGSFGRPDVVIWPETAITFLPQDAPNLVARIAASAQGPPLITGALFYERDAEGQRQWFNSLMVATEDGQITDRYDKHHLVPFGEYLPGRWLLESIGLEAIAGMGGAGFVAGPGPRTITVQGLPPFAAAICYELIFPGGFVADNTRPGWILHLTNDAWFGDFAGPQQHLAQARIRAIEQGLPVVRAANTGISAVIDATGRVTHALPLGTHGAIDTPLPAALAPTIYSRSGDTPVLALLLLGAVGFLVRPSMLRRPD